MAGGSGVDPKNRKIINVSSFTSFQFVWNTFQTIQQAQQI